jgi:hypothetical protein
MAVKLLTKEYLCQIKQKSSSESNKFFKTFLHRKKKAELFAEMLCISKGNSDERLK